MFSGGDRHDVPAARRRLPPPIEVGPAPEPDPTRRWAITAVAAVIGLIVAVRRLRPLSR